VFTLRLVYRSRTAFEFNGKGKGRTLNKGKGNIAEGKGNIAEIEFSKLLLNPQVEQWNNMGWITCMVGLNHSFGLAFTSTI